MWLRHDSRLWRKAFALGVEHGPDFLVRFSPPVFGVAFGAALAGPRVRVRETLRLILGPQEPARELALVAEVFANFASSMTEGMLVAAGRGYEASCRSAGGAHYTEALGAGRGVIVATAHTAGWEIGSSLAQAHGAGRSVVVVMAAERDRGARELSDAYREKRGLRVMHVGGDPLSAMPLLRHLRDGGVAAMMLDRVADGMRTRQARLFGEPFRVSDGLLRLAALTGASIVPAFTRRLGFLEYETVQFPALHCAARPTDAALDAAAAELCACFEAFLRDNPTQWFRFG